jgi:hypothetical protein
VASCHVAYLPDGLAQLATFLHQTLAAASVPQELACLIETTHGLLITALLDAGFAVYPVNPKTVDRRRKPSGAKTDAIDAFRLAKTGRSDLADRRRLTPDSPLVQEREGAHPRPRPAHPDPDAPGHSTDGVPEGVLSRGLDALHHAAAAPHPRLPADLSNAGGGA